MGLPIGSKAYYTTCTLQACGRRCKLFTLNGGAAHSLRPQQKRLPTEDCQLKTFSGLVFSAFSASASLLIGNNAFFKRFAPDKGEMG